MATPRSKTFPDLHTNSFSIPWQHSQIIPANIPRNLWLPHAWKYPRATWDGGNHGMGWEWIIFELPFHPIHSGIYLGFGLQGGTTKNIPEIPNLRSRFWDQQHSNRTNFNIWNKRKIEIFHLLSLPHIQVSTWSSCLAGWSFPRNSPVFSQIWENTQRRDTKIPNQVNPNPVGIPKPP